MVLRIRKVLNIIIKSFSYFQLFLIPRVLQRLFFLVRIFNTIFIMKSLAEYKDEIHSCSKCGLCQSVCPIYKITGNDCTVSRGMFIMLKQLIKGELKMSKKLNRYLDLCLKCNACTKFCPSGIDVVDIIASAKAEYFKQHKTEKLKSAILELLLKFPRLLHKYTPKAKSKTFEKKVIYFGGCGSTLKTEKAIVKLLNSANIEVIIPEFECCGYPFFVRGDTESYKACIDKFYNTLNKYGIYDVVTNCATCEKTLNSVSKIYNNININIKNVFEYIKENNLKLELNKEKTVTYHKPCNLDNFENVKWILENTKNLNYIEMKDFDECCGFEGLTNFNDRKILSKIYKQKHENIKNTGAKTVLTSCLACAVTLKLHSHNKYKVQDFAEFLAKNIK